MNKDLNEEELQDLYAWIDKIKLSRPKRNISRDFSDGGNFKPQMLLMTAELVKYFFPKLVDLHNYTPAHATQQKLSNWSTLNRKVFSKLNFNVPDDILKKVVLCTPGSIESILCALKERLEDKRTTKDSDATQTLQYNTTVNEKQQTENLVAAESSNNNTAWVKNTQKSSHFISSSIVDPPIRLLLEEKDQALLALQEIVEILQIKVNRLEHLVHLKDLHIEDLTKHLEQCKAHNKIQGEHTEIFRNTSTMKPA